MTGWDIMDLESLVDEYFILKANEARGEYVICNNGRIENRLIWKHGTESWKVILSDRKAPVSDVEIWDRQDVKLSGQRHIVDTLGRRSTNNTRKV